MARGCLESNLFLHLLGRAWGSSFSVLCCAHLQNVEATEPMSQEAHSEGLLLSPVLALLPLRGSLLQQGLGKLHWLTLKSLAAR